MNESTMLLLTILLYMILVNVIIGYDIRYTCYNSNKHYNIAINLLDKVLISNRNELMNTIISPITNTISNEDISRTYIELLRLLLNKNDYIRILELFPMYIDDVNTTHNDANVIGLLFNILLTIKHKHINTIGNSLIQLSKACIKDNDVFIIIQSLCNIRNNNRSINNNVLIPKYDQYKDIILRSKSTLEVCMKLIIEIHQRSMVYESSKHQMIIDSFAMIDAIVHDYYYEILTFQYISNSNNSMYTDALNLIDTLFLNDNNDSVDVYHSNDYLIVKDFISMNNDSSNLKKWSYLNQVRYDDMFNSIFKYILPYSNAYVSYLADHRNDNILIYGDGDFSFTYSLINELHYTLSRSTNNITITTTSYESESSLTSKYINASSNVIELLQNNNKDNKVQVQIKWMIDSTKHQQHEYNYDTYIFNFPFADTNNNLVDDDTNNTNSRIFDTQYLAKGRHIKLLNDTLKNIKTIEMKKNMKRKVYCYITLLMSQAIAWSIGDIADIQGYMLEIVLPFDFTYNRKRTYNDDTFKSSSDTSRHQYIGWTFVLSYTTY